MQGFAEQKVAGGKLLKAQIEFDSTIIKTRFFGDFFLHPEETITAIEESVAGLPTNFSLSALEQKIRAVLQANHAELVGVSAKDFVVVVQEAIRNARKK